MTTSNFPFSKKPSNANVVPLLFILGLEVELMENTGIPKALLWARKSVIFSLS
jgi:hypothetical protein